jgi:acyl-CoA thioesterase II
LSTIDELTGALRLEQIDADRYRADNVPSPHGVVFGGQLMAQSVMAGLAGTEGMAVKTLHTVFARGGTPEVPVDIAVERMQSGRTFASATVTISQQDRLRTRSIVLLSAPEDDLIRHAAAPTRRPDPDDAAAMEGSTGAWEVRVVDGVDVNDPEATGPAELDVWTRFVGAPEDPAVNQALLAFATDGFLIGTAMRPHPGVGQAQAHRTLSTGVISHTITFHEPCPVADWLLLSHTSPYAGHGRSYGRADVFARDGQLVASFVQDAMIRPMPAQSTGAL